MAATSVSSRVRAAHRGRILLVTLESSIVGVSAAIATLAAASTAPVVPKDPQMVALLGLVGILAAFSWWTERNDDAAAVARSIDRRSGLGGALTTAFESESSGDPSPIAAALAQAMSRVVSLRPYFGHEARTSAVVLAAPFLAVSLFAAFPQPSSLERWGDLRGRVRDLASLPGLSAGDAEALQSIAERTDRIHAHPITPSQQASLAESLARLERELADLERRVEAARGPATGGGVASGVGNGTMGSPAPPVDRPTDGPMREPPASNPAPEPNAPIPSGPGPEGGVGSPRWWPERYDGVVERWIEARRAAAAGRTR